MPALDFSELADAGRQYGPSEGEPALRSLIAQSLSALGMACGADQVLVTSGSQQGIDLIGKLFIDEGLPVVLEAPIYLATIQALGVYGAQFQGLPRPATGSILIRCAGPSFANGQPSSISSRPSRTRRAIATRTKSGAPLPRSSTQPGCP